LGSPSALNRGLLRDDEFERPGFSELLRRAFAGDEQRAPVYWFEARPLEPEGRQQPRTAIEATFVPLCDSAGVVSYVAVGFKDITAEMLLRSTAEALERSELRFRGTFEQAAVGVAHVAPDGTWLEVNRRLCDIVGYTPEELRVRTFQDITYPPDLSGDLELVQKALAGAISTYSLEKRYVRKDGSLVWVDLTVSLVRDAVGSPLYFISLIQDISSRRQAEERLRESEAMKAAMLSAALDCVVSADCAGLITEFNPAAERTFGYSRAEIVGRPLVELVPPALRARHLAGFARYLDVGVGTVIGKRIEISALHASGAEFPVELAVVPTHIHGTLFFTAYLRDITERRRAAEALQTSEARFRHLADAGIIGVIVTDLLGNVHEANDAFLGLVGFSREELYAGKVSWADMTPPEWRATDEAAIVRLQATGVAPPWEKEYIRKDGQRTPVLVGVAMLDAQRGIAFVLDLTAQKHAEQARAHAISFAEREIAGRVRAERALEHTEEQLRQSQKMEAIGVLAGNVAHDFNNLLSVILGHSELVLDELRTGDPIRDGLTQIKRAAESAAELTRQLLAFGRCQVLEPRVVGLNISVSGMTRMLRRIIGEDIELVVHLADDLGSTFVDPGQMEQVLLNLVVNARDAMPQGGKLTIETADVVLDDAYARTHVDVVAGRYVMLSVSDTGAGMESATQERVFEPFFTTKPKGKGTGLGLSSVYGIVKQSGGNIWMESALGKGTIFRVYLPRTDAPLELAVSSPAAPLGRGHETVLLVEDDERVRALAAAVLRRQGYVVLEAPSGGDALLICEQFVGTIDLLLTDVVMPHMNGRQLWERLSELRPALRVLFMTGHTDDAILRHGVMNAELALVQKPLTPSALLGKLRQVLDQAE